MRFSVLLILFFILCTPILAQEVEFHIPTEIDIIQGQLSVVFNEDVSEDEALAIIKRLNYNVLEINFSPVIITGEVEKAVEDKILRKLHADKRTLEVKQYTSPVISHDPVETATKQMIAVTFQTGQTSTQAKKWLKKRVHLLSVNSQTLPNEMIISVGNQDEEAFEVLQDHKKIKWVSYVGTSEDY